VVVVVVEVEAEEWRFKLVVRQWNINRESD
jgi:hypothetical protein